MLSPDKILPAIVATACLVALVRLCLGARRQRQFDQAVLGLWYRLKALPQRIKNRPMSKKEAAQLAQEAIERARKNRRNGADDGNWDGNVYRPKSFKGPRKPH